MAPTQWVTSQNARPHRITLNGVYELPFGRGRAFLNDGGWLGKILGGWQTGQTFEWQPGPLLQFGNVFYYGDVDDIALDDSTLDEWFDVDAGFERNATRVPADFQERLFPMRVDGLRADKTLLLNSSIVPNVPVERPGQAPVPHRRREFAEPSAVRQSEPDDDGDRFRPRDGKRQHRAAVPDRDDEGDVLNIDAGPQRASAACRIDVWEIGRRHFGAGRQADGRPYRGRIVLRRLMSHAP